MNLRPSIRLALTLAATALLGAGCSHPSAPPTPTCGDGTLDSGEQCDDGNRADGDGCESDCTVTREITCQNLEPLAAGTCEVIAGGADRLLEGDVLTPDIVLRGGQVLYSASGQIRCVGCDCAGQAPDATRIRCPRGVISPGLINPHDHITYAQNDPYTDTGERYEARHDWLSGRHGHTAIPYEGSATTDEIRWGELRFVLGGATSTLGSGSALGLLRNLDKSAQEGLGQPPVDYSVFPLGDSNGTQRTSDCDYPSIDTEASIAADDAYVPHVSEGIDAYANNEFDCLSSDENGGQDLLQPKSAFIHSVALTPLQYAQMAQEDTILIWSPRSNIALYGDTALVTVAARLGVRIALGTDWIVTGSMNMERELQCADFFNRDYLGGFFDDRELWRMVTLHAAEAAKVDDVIGSLAAGRVADIAVFDGAAHPDYRAVIDAAPQDVVLVVRGGQVLYGDEAIVAGLAPGACDELEVCGTAKRLCAQDDIGMSLSALQSSVGDLYPLYFCGAVENEPTCIPSRPSAVNGSGIYSGARTASDFDGDGLPDASDNCPGVFNPVRPMDDGVQPDADRDGLGDVCDPCPFNADTTDCTPPDPDDRDADGVTNLVDNCPNVPNPTQADADADGRGDACDGCPDFANPAPHACPVSIYAVKQGSATGTVAISGALVTGCAPGNGFFVQVEPDDPGYQGADHSGVFVYHPAVTCAGDVAPGDRVDLDPATVGDYFGQIQLEQASVSVSASGEPAPAPVTVTSVQASGAAPIALEAVLVQIQNAIVTAVDSPPQPSDSSPTNEFVLDGVLPVNDLLYLAEPFPLLDQNFASITGILDYRNGRMKLEPRQADDLILGPPTLESLTPAVSFVRQGAADAPTLPTPLTVVLSGPALGDTFVPVVSSDPNSLTVVGGGVTVPDGTSNQAVRVDALMPANAVTLTASLDAVERTAQVRVLDPAEQPEVAALLPAQAVAPLSGTVALSVRLDIPAGPGGATVELALDPGTFGSLPATVVVPEDAIQAEIVFQAGAAEGSEQVTASLGASSATARVDIIATGTAGLVINELDYDNPGDDTLEFVGILNTTELPVNLAGLALVLVNGGNDTEYRRIALGGTLTAGAYLVLGSQALLDSLPAGVPAIALPLAKDNLQNGSPDAVGLLDTASGELLDALSYEGSITAGVLTGVADPLDFVEGTPTEAKDTNSAPGCLARLPDGQDTDDASADWAFTPTPTPGAPNLP